MCIGMVIVTLHISVGLDRAWVCGVNFAVSRVRAVHVFHSTSERCYLISFIHTSRSPEPREIAIRHLKNNLFDLSSRRASQHFLLRLEVIILLFSLHPQLFMIHCDCFLYKNLWVTSYVFWCKGSNVPFFKKKIDRFTHLFPLTWRFLLFSVAKSGMDKWCFM